MKFLWIISNGLTYWFEHTDQGDEDPPGSFLSFPWQPPPVFCTALILIYNFKGVAIKGGSNCCSFDLRQTKVSAHHLSVHGRVCKLQTCSKRVQNFSGIGDRRGQIKSVLWHFGPIWEFGTLAVRLDQTSCTLFLSHSLTLKVVYTFFHLDRWGNSWMSLMWKNRLSIFWSASSASPVMWCRTSFSFRFYL